MSQRIFRITFLMTLVGLAACASSTKVGGRGPREPKVDPTPALKLLQATDFDGAEASALEILQKESDNSVARAIAALVLYKKTVRQFINDGFSAMAGAFNGQFNHQYMRFALEKTEKSLDEVEAHLAIASTDTGFRMPLCLACWERDWNHNGRIDSRDRKLFQVEYDSDGSRIQEDDPRRNPTFKFDSGDIYWARAMVAFQRAAVNLVLAYKWTEIDGMLRTRREKELEKLVVRIRLQDPERVKRSRDLILDGLEYADQSRKDYLAETDDEGEWLPNPNQKKHPLPLPVDAALYETWAGVLRDLRVILEGKEGISITEVAQLGDHVWEEPPTGFINIGKLLDSPGDIVLVGSHINKLDRNRTRQGVEQVLRDTFGEGYVSQMKATPLLKRAHRMKSEIQRGEESFERKLRYLIWLN